MTLCTKQRTKYIYGPASVYTTKDEILSKSRTHCTSDHLKQEKKNTGTKGKKREAVFKRDLKGKWTIMFKLKGEPEQITEGVEEYIEVWERKLVKARRLLKREVNTGPWGEI